MIGGSIAASERKGSGRKKEFRFQKSQYSIFYMAGTIWYGAAVVQGDGAGIQDVGVAAGQLFSALGAPAVAVFILVQEACPKGRGSDPASDQHGDFCTVFCGMEFLCLPVFDLRRGKRAEPA